MGRIHFLFLVLLLFCNMMLAQERGLKIGQTPPELVYYSFTAEKTIKYKKDDFKNKVFLVDFWATWCLPCIGEIPNLQKAYDKYHSKGLQIISISSDANQTDVHTFRMHKAVMPWKHAWISGGDLKLIHAQFEVTGIPKPILVDREGVILGLKSEVRGENLDRVLEKLFRK